jgi:hypothetical protein
MMDDGIMAGSGSRSHSADMCTLQGKAHADVLIHPSRHTCLTLGT